MLVTPLGVTTAQTHSVPQGHVMFGLSTLNLCLFTMIAGRPPLPFLTNGLEITSKSSLNIFSILCSSVSHDSDTQTISTFFSFTYVLKFSCLLNKLLGLTFSITGSCKASTSLLDLLITFSVLGIFLSAFLLVIKMSSDLLASL